MAHLKSSPTRWRWRRSYTIQTLAKVCIAILVCDEVNFNKKRITNDKKKMHFKNWLVFIDLKEIEF